VEGLTSRHKVQKIHSWFQHSGKTSCGSLDERRNLPLFHNGENALPDPGIPLADKVPQSQPDVPRFVLHKSLFPAWTHRYPLDVFENFFRPCHFCKATRYVPGMQRSWKTVLQGQAEHQNCWDNRDHSSACRLVSTRESIFSALDSRRFGWGYGSTCRPELQCVQKWNPLKRVSCRR